MLANTLSMTVLVMENYQKEHPEIYQEYELILEDLKSNMNKVSYCLMVTESLNEHRTHNVGVGDSSPTLTTKKRLRIIYTSQKYPY